MKIINKCNNTVYIDDLDIHMPYKNGEVEILESEQLKKSKSLRGFVLSEMVDIIEYSEKEQIEVSLVYLKNKLKKTEAQMTVETEPEIANLTPVSNQIEVKLHGIFYDAGGYAKVNRNLAMKLHEAGIKVQVSSKRTSNQLTEEELKPIISLSNTKLSKNHILIDSVIPTFGEMSSGQYKVLYTTIESYSVPNQFLQCCEGYDEIWLTSDFSANILKSKIKKPIYVVPTGADHNLYTLNGPKFDFSPNIKDFVFISVFSWGYRKGYDVLLKAFFDEFSADDNVSLLIMSRYQSGNNRFHRNKIKNDIEDIMNQFPNKDLPHVVRYSKVLPEQDMPKLYRAANCFISVSRGEGGGLPPVEASLCGLPIIMTNCSGQQQYLNNDRSYLIEIDRISEAPVGRFGIHYWDGQMFPELLSKEVHENVKKTMRHVVNNYSEAKQKNDLMRNFILENLTWNNTANAAIKRLKIISNKLRK